MVSPGVQWDPGTPPPKLPPITHPPITHPPSPPRSWKVWDRVVLPQISKALITAILLARDAGALAQHRLVESSAPSRYRRVLLLSPDFIVDDSGEAFLEEVNTNGFLVGDDELYKAQGDTIDLMRLVGADGWPARPLYSEGAAELVNDFLSSGGYDTHDAGLIKPSLKELIHEEVASHTTQWRRIFPAPLDLSHESQLQQGRGFSTDLDEATSDFLKYRMRSPALRKLVDVIRLNATARALEAVQQQQQQQQQGETES